MNLDVAVSTSATSSVISPTTSTTTSAVSITSPVVSPANLSALQNDAIRAAQAAQATQLARQIQMISPGTFLPSFASHVA